MLRRPLRVAPFCACPSHPLHPPDSSQAPQKLSLALSVSKMEPRGGEVSRTCRSLGVLFLTLVGRGRRTSVSRRVVPA